MWASSNWNRPQTFHFVMFFCFKILSKTLALNAAAYWNVRILQGVGVQALTMRELQKDNVDTDCLLEDRIPGSGHSVVKVPGEETWYNLNHNGGQQRKSGNSNRPQRRRLSCTLGVGANLAFLS